MAQRKRCRDPRCSPRGNPACAGKAGNPFQTTQGCPTLSDPMDSSLPGSSIHGIFQARVLELGAIAFSVDGCTIVYLWACICGVWGETEAERPSQAVSCCETKLTRTGR